MKFRIVQAGLLAAIALGMQAAGAQDATGAGASFPQPVYAKWAEAYSKATGVRINYQSIGSSAGLKQIAAKTVDFGASDMPLKDEELAKGGYIQFPTVMGGVVPVVNIAGVKAGEMKLTGDVLADIYLGKIKKWNDKAIAALNPGLKLPDAQIAVVRRSDGSGTTFVFTNYLSKVSAEWKTKVGENAAPNWPTGAGGKGNDGVASFVGRLPNSIGYVEYAFAKQGKLSHVSLKNAAGAFVQPDDATFKAAASGADWNRSFYQVLTNQSGKDAWPLTSATFIIMHKVQDKPAQGTATLKFFEWAFSQGDKLAADLEYVPMPDAVKGLSRKAWSEVKDGAGKPVLAK